MPLIVVMWISLAKQVEAVNAFFELDTAISVNCISLV